MSCALLKFVVCYKTGAVFSLTLKINPDFIYPSSNDFLVKSNHEKGLLQKDTAPVNVKC